MNCHEMNSKLPDLLFESEMPVAGDVQLHLADCGACRQQLDELRATMSLMDAWEAPEPNPYFMTRLNARLAEEREVAPAGWPRSWFEKLRARLEYGSRVTLRPLAAMSMTVVLLLGGGAYLGFNDWEQTRPQPVQAAVVQDLQTLDTNAQLLDQLETLSDQNND